MKHINGRVMGGSSGLVDGSMEHSEESSHEIEVHNRCRSGTMAKTRHCVSHPMNVDGA